MKNETHNKVMLWNAQMDSAASFYGRNCQNVNQANFVGYIGHFYIENKLLVAN